jgi:hypothetical protein
LVTWTVLVVHHLVFKSEGQTGAIAPGLARHKLLIVLLTK